MNDQTNKPSPDVVEPTTTVPEDDQPKSGPMWLCRGCGAGLVARGAEGSGYCRECFAGQHAE